VVGRLAQWCNGNVVTSTPGCCTSSPVSTGMGDRLWTGIPSSYMQPTMLTQPCIPPGPLNRVPALAGVNAGILCLSGAGNQLFSSIYL